MTYLNSSHRMPRSSAAFFKRNLLSPPALLSLIFPLIVNPGSPGSAHAADFVWVEDAVPAGAWTGADGGDAWTWVSSNPTPFSGGLAHQSNLASGLHQHYFNSASSGLVVNPGDVLVAYVFLDPANVPSEMLLQWHNGTWEHRAYWGANLLNWGANGTAAQRPMGSLPPAGQWARLEIPANLVGLEGSTVIGMSFTLYGGRATWDHIGKSSSTSQDTTPPTVAITQPANGSTVSGTSVQVVASASDNVGVAGVQFKLDDANLGAEDTTAPYSATWNSTATPNGSHALTAVARDGAGNQTTSAPIMVTVSNSTPPPGGGDAGTVHYPDLQTLPPSDLTISSNNGRKELRFSTRTVNFGNGPLEVVGQHNPAAGTTDAFQRLYSHDANGNWYVVSSTYVGTFIFHTEHNHWHVENFGTYELRDVAGDGSIGSTVLANSAKVSSCLLDSFSADPTLPHAQPKTYTECTADLPQGISVGWGDWYPYYLAGQSLDLIGVRDGDYWLLLIADPNNRLNEGGGAAELNNTGTRKIRIRRNRVYVLQ